MLDLESAGRATGSLSWVSRASGCVDGGGLRSSGCAVRALVGEQVVDDPRGGAPTEWPADRAAGFAGASRMTASRQVGLEAVQRVAFDRSPGGLPITAVPTTMPSVSKATCVRLPLGSVTQPGWRTR